MELIKMTDREVAKRMYDYVIRTNNLLNLVSKVLNRTSDKVDKDFIKEEYKLLKEAIKEDAHYMSLSRNKKRDESILQTRFNWAVQEASAYGFIAAVNSKIDYKFFSSIEEARYRLTKGTSEEKWKELSEK